jgi:hypothetical protein
MFHPTAKFGFVVLLLSVGGTVIAQDSAVPPSTNQAEVEVRQQAELSPEEQVTQAESIHQRGVNLSRRVSASLDESRREKDIIRVTCLNDKLTQVNANLRTVEQRLGSLGESAQGGDASRRNHEFTVLTVLGQKFDVLEQEANQCLGQDIFETGATRIVTTIDPSTPTDDPTITPEAPSVLIPFIPPPASPVM